MGEEEIKQSLFSDHMVIHVESPKQLKKKKNPPGTNK